MRYGWCLITGRSDRQEGHSWDTGSKSFSSAKILGENCFLFNRRDAEQCLMAYTFSGFLH